MVSIRGTFRNGCAQPEEAVEGRDGQPVIITFLEDGSAASPDVLDMDAEWKALRQMLKDAQADTGISDLAHEHDHYVHGKPKRGE
jgi:hypothetical protein